MSATDPQKRFVSVDSLRKHVFHELLIWSAEKGYDQTPQGHAEGDLGEFILVDYRHQDLPELAASLPSSDVTAMEGMAQRGQEVLQEREQPEPCEQECESHGYEQIFTRAKTALVKVGQPSFRHVKKRVLERRLKMPLAQYEALNEQYDDCLDAGIKVVLESKISKLADQSESVELEINQIS